MATLPKPRFVTKEDLSPLALAVEGNPLLECSKADGAAPQEKSKKWEDVTGTFNASYEVQKYTC